VPFGNYTDLQSNVMTWLARPADPNLSGNVPDMIILFEEEARDRLKTRFNEIATAPTPLDVNNSMPLPSDYGAMRLVTASGNPSDYPLRYLTPEVMLQKRYPGWMASQYEVFTIRGSTLFAAPGTSSNQTVTLLYTQGIPPLASATTNWLLQNFPSLYLFGTLVEALPFIGDDERAGEWIQRREAAFARILASDLNERFAGGTLQIQADCATP